MLFERKGLICNAEMLGLPWCRKNLMVPLPYLRHDGGLRIYVTMCDEKNVGRIGYVDVDPNNPSVIIRRSETPLVDVGIPGTYDDNGVVTASILEEADRVLLYYSGYELSAKIPYKIFCGVAESNDDGCCFRKLNQASILPPIDQELFNRCAPYVRKEGDGYRMFYLGDAGNLWRKDRNGHHVPMYTLKTLFSDDPVKWPLEAGTTVMPFEDQEECGITLPNIWRENGNYKMIYSIRRVNLGYTLGYSESSDGVHFKRKDAVLDFVGPRGNWECEMMCFAELITVGSRTYMFYCGNHYGIGGMGWAELIKW